MRPEHSLASPIGGATARRSSVTLWPGRDEPLSHSLCPNRYSSRAVRRPGRKWILPSKLLGLKGSLHQRALNTDLRPKCLIACRSRAGPPETRAPSAELTSDPITDCGGLTSRPPLSHCRRSPPGTSGTRSFGRAGFSQVSQTDDCSRHTASMQ
jgi:hypothetical protein